MMEEPMDTEYTSHAEYLANSTDITHREAEAYLRWYLSDDATTQRENARRMGVQESTYSEQLSTAREKIDSDEATCNALQTLLAVTPIGGLGKTKEVIASGPLPGTDVFTVITKEWFDSEDRITSKYRVHLVYRESGSEHLGDDAPDSITHYDKWSFFTVKENDKDTLVRSVDYYVDTIDSLGSPEKYHIMKFLDESGFDVEVRLKGLAEIIVEELSVGASDKNQESG